MHKPPLLVLHEDVESVEFCRQGGGGAASTKTFDLAIRDRTDQVWSLNPNPCATCRPSVCHASHLPLQWTALRRRRRR